MAEKTKRYEEEFVYTTAEDGVFLEGAVIRPTGKPVQPLPIVWVHGFTGRFYEPHPILIGRVLASRGYTFVTGHNRGHNFGAVLYPKGQESRLGGAAWEKLTESPLDIGAWITFAVDLGFRQVILLGHSLGGMKVTYYQAVRQDPRVRGLVVASGPIWRFVGPAPESVARLGQAERMVAEGRGRDLLPWQADWVRTLSAQRVVDTRQFNQELFGLDGKAPAISRIRCPIFAFIGSEEQHLGTAADLEAIKSRATATPRMDTRVFEGADHVYSGHEAEVGTAIADWVDSVQKE
jgi:pimeloyl-ACP methyl ester carboxylesterase